MIDRGLAVPPYVLECPRVTPVTWDSPMPRAFLQPDHQNSQAIWDPTTIDHVVVSPAGTSPSIACVGPPVEQDGSIFGDEVQCALPMVLRRRCGASC